MILLKDIKNIKKINELISKSESQLKDLEEKLNNPKVAAALVRNGLESRLNIKLKIYKALKSDITSNSIIAKILNKLGLI